MSACADPCDEVPPLVELAVIGDFDGDAPAQVALRRPQGEWANVLCDPGARLGYPEVPRWEGQCDLVALQFASVYEEQDLEVAVLGLDGRLAHGVVYIGAPSCERTPRAVMVKAEALDPSADEMLCGAVCERRSTCTALPPSDGCQDDCLSQLAQEACQVERRALNACWSRLDCDYWEEDESGTSRICAPFQDAYDLCVANL